MALQFTGKKVGMTRMFDKSGNVVVCTVIRAEPNIVTQLKTKENDGYTAIQLGSMKVTDPKKRNVSKPLRGHFAKAAVEPRGRLLETRLSDTSAYQVGQEIGVGVFTEVAYVDVTGMSKGKGHQGVIKRHGFAGGPASHGSGFHRHGGSCGMRTSPGRCLPGQKKSGRMGGERVAQQNLKVVKVDEVNQVLLVEGAIPGSRGGFVVVSPAVKKPSKK